MNRWHTREDSGIVLDAEGRWWHDGQPVEHPKIAAVFDAGLQPADDGRYKLVIGNDWCFVQVQGAAYRVLDVNLSEGSAELRLSDGTREQLEPASLSTDADGILEAQVKDGRARARFSRSAQTRLGACLEPAPERAILRLGSLSFTTAIDSAALR